MVVAIVGAALLLLGLPSALMTYSLYSGKKSNMAISFVILVISSSGLATVIAKQIESYNLIEQKKVYRIEASVGDSIRRYTGTNLSKNDDGTLSFDDSATGNTVALQNPIVTRIRDSLNQGKTK